MKVQPSKSNPVRHQLKKEYLSALAQVRRDLFVDVYKILIFDLNYGSGENTVLHLRQDFEVSNTPLFLTQSYLSRKRCRSPRGFKRLFGLGALLQNCPPKL